MGRWASLARRRRQARSWNSLGRWPVRSSSLSGMSLSAGIRFTRPSHSLIVGSSSRSNMVATLFGFLVILPRVIQFRHDTLLPQSCTVEIQEGVQNRPQSFTLQIHARGALENLKGVETSAL